jgi:glycosyltransferase involved in cell wall biosynthesis
LASFVLCSNITNQAGLEKDYHLLRSTLESLGHSVQGVMFNEQCPPLHRVDVVIFLEVVDARWIPYAKQAWMLPNSEWWGDCWNMHIPAFSKVICKTKDCFYIWSKKVGSKAIYTGFEANDFYMPDVVRKPTFLHLAGKSETKNTAAVMQAWREFNIPYPLIASVSKPQIYNLCTGVNNVAHVYRLSDDEVVQALNECQFHIMPSRYEGFGMSIHEALGCGGAVITTDGPPMNEFSGIDKRLLVPVVNKSPRNSLTCFYDVSARGVAEAIHRAAQMSAEDLQQISRAARAGFLSDREFFRKTFAEVVG